MERANERESMLATHRVVANALRLVFVPRYGRRLDALAAFLRARVPPQS